MCCWTLIRRVLQKLKLLIPGPEGSGLFRLTAPVMHESTGITIPKLRPNNVPTDMSCSREAIKVLLLRHP